MTELSVTPPTAAPVAPASGDATPPALAQASQRAEFSARLLAALAALRGLPAAPGAPAPADAEAGALSADVALAPEEASAEEAPDDAAPADAPATGVATDFVPLVLPQLASGDTVERSSEDEAAPADGEPEAEIPADPASENEPAPRPATFAAFASLQPTKEAKADTPPEAAAAAPAPAPAAASADPARRAAKESSEVAPRAPEPASEPALARGPELAAPPAAAARSESAAPTPGRVLPELPVRNEQEIVDQVRFLLNRRGGQASIELHPPQLGQVGLRISVTDHAVRLEITADRLQVAELLHKHLPQLQQALEAQGLSIDRAQVDLRERASDGRERGGDPGDPDARRGRDSDGEGSPRPSGYPRAALPAYSLGAVDVHA